ncbi:hemerythrin domain-containing protein [Nonomuraea dietziae]|uniref:Hemerythrin superfamily protein n=1 Tax=Nonomuraea dietziae TaxID=65515 RepID=A0A7W5UYN7_9ACTN|nr:hemerythrin domain-containing protein [Nonomuraea dietziae]MBB3724460.1 hemerythrin superfamily protein [Nonomuraea dietziae]
MSTPTGNDVIDVLTHDHREVEEMFTELEQLGTADVERRQKLTEKVIIELVRHSVAEEAYLYPAVRDILPDGDKLADRELAEHAQAEETMKQLERTDAGEPGHAELLARLMAEIRDHIAEEEGDLFLRLRSAASPEQLDELGRKVEAIKKVAPTRPHPAAPDTPPANKMMGPATGLIDRMRDALSGRGKD